MLRTLYTRLRIQIAGRRVTMKASHYTESRVQVHAPLKGLGFVFAAVFLGTGILARAAGPSPTDLDWLRSQCGDGALLYFSKGSIYLTELSDGKAVKVAGKVPNGHSFEFSPDSSKLAWIEGATAKGRMRRGDTTVHTILTDVSKSGGIHWISNTEVVLVKAGKWYRIKIDGTRE